jgi:hypothetical protein
MSGRVLILVAGALAVVAVERLASAMLVTPRDDNGLTVRLLIAFLCGGAAPVVFLLGYLKARATRPGEVGKDR